MKSAQRAVVFLAWSFGGLFTVAAIVLVTARIVAGARERDSREALAPANGRLIATSEGRLFLQESGPKDGRVVVLVHGTGAWSEIWRPVMTALADRGYRAIAVDLPPFGFSDRSHAADYEPATQARLLWAALDVIGVRNVVLVGHSFGARATVAAALLHPSRIERLVLVDAALGLSDTLSASVPPPLFLRALLAVEPARSALVAATITNPRLTRWLTGKLVAHPERLTDAQIRMLQLPMTQRGSTRAASDWLPGFVLGPGPDVKHARHLLASFPTVTNVIWGELDDLTPVAQGQDLTRLFPCSTWDLLAGTGHIPGLENPRGLSDALVSRLAEPPDCPRS